MDIWESSRTSFGHIVQLGPGRAKTSWGSPGMKGQPLCVLCVLTCPISTWEQAMAILQQIVCRAFRTPNKQWFRARYHNLVNHKWKWEVKLQLWCFGGLKCPTLSQLGTPSPTPPHTAKEICFYQLQMCIWTVYASWTSAISRCGLMQ